MKKLKFEWDNRKNSSNQKKHGISFDEATTAFYDENGKFMTDPDHSSDEDRFILIGISSSLRTLVVCHCFREKGFKIRIISARKASKSEKKQYGGTEK